MSGFDTEHAREHLIEAAKAARDEETEPGELRWFLPTMPVMEAVRHYGEAYELLTEGGEL